MEIVPVSTVGKPGNQPQDGRFPATTGAEQTYLPLASMPNEMSWQIGDCLSYAKVMSLRERNSAM